MTNVDQLTTNRARAHSILESYRQADYKRLLNELQSTGEPLTDPQILRLLAENAELSARLRIIEEYLASHGDRPALQQSTAPITGGPAQPNQAGQTELKTSISLLASDLSKAQNWYELEQSSQGIPICWSGPGGKNIFNLPLKRTGVLIATLSVIAVIDPSYLSSLSIFIDGQLVEHRLVENGKQIEIQFDIAANPLHKAGETEIVLVLPGTHSPVEQGHEEDYRRLGIAVSSLKIRRKWPRYIESMIAYITLERPGKS